MLKPVERFKKVGIQVFVFRKLIVVSPDPARCKRSFIERTIIGDGGSRALDIPLFELFGMMKMTGGNLRRPIACRSQSQTRGPRIERALIEVPPMLIGFGAMKRASFEQKHFALDPNSQNIIGDMR